MTKASHSVAGSEFHEAPASPGTTLPALARAGVVGAGTMGTGIALAFANAGLAVVLADTSGQALERARAELASHYDEAVKKGRLRAEEARRRRDSIALAGSLDALAGCDVAVEAVFEELDLKRRVFAALGDTLRGDALLGTNTSTLDVDAIAAAAPAPERSLGTHFFSPAHVMKLLEIVRGAATSAATVERALRLAERLGKIPVVVGNCDGFVGNRMLRGYRREAERLVLEGAAPEAVDAPLERFGFALGPFAVADLAGVDVGWRAMRERMRRGAAPPYAQAEFSDRLVAAGRLGRKSGRGWYRYEPERRRGVPDAAVERLVAAERGRLGFTPRHVCEREIVERCVFALVNEGYRLLDEGIARSAADIDTVWIFGYGFPQARGGPLRYAEGVGLDAVLATIRRFAELDPAFWQPARLLESCVAAGTVPESTARALLDRPL